jgi:uncharacterized protein (TIGR00369 family)
MYLKAPINKIYPPEINVEKGKSTISLEIIEDYFHVADGLHGSVYFKLLDDACTFAANSMFDDNLAFTASFKINFVAPVSVGQIRAIAECVKVDGRKVYTRAQLFDQNNKEVGNGEGLFIKGNKKFTEYSKY